MTADILVSVLPFATFSLFHCLTFLRQNVLPRFAPKYVSVHSVSLDIPAHWVAR